MHDFNDLEYWANRWSECFPRTYPPELVSMETEKVTTGIWFWKRTYFYSHAVCARCNERIYTGHQCKDIQEYIKNGLE